MIVAFTIKTTSELTEKLERLKENHKREVTGLKDHFSAQLDQMKLSNERVKHVVTVIFPVKAIEHLTAKNLADVKALEDKHSAEVTGLKAKVDSQSSTLTVSARPCCIVVGSY